MVRALRAEGSEKAVRFILAILAAWIAICLVPDGRSVEARGGNEVTETVWMSRECTNSNWFLEKADDEQVTLGCYPQSDDGGN
jgi:hypothetical protein